MTQIAADENEAFTASSVHHCHCFHPQMTQIAADENEAFNRSHLCIIATVFIRR
jgi:hypothetical protein